MDRNAFETRLQQEGYDEILMIDRPAADPRVVHDHVHDFDVLAMVLSGGLTVRRPEGNEDFAAGGTFAVPAGCLHSEMVGPQGVSLLVGRRRARAEA